ncbi:MAG: L-threonylcarbamoyladenylate synthase [Gemmatimonadaceae bacterium]
MRILPPDDASIAHAAAVIRRGGLVAFPTETVYGLGADALSEAAVRGIFAAKGRPSTNPLIVHVADEAGVAALAAEWPERARRLAARFWPGPLTLVVPKRDVVPDAVTAGLANVALRVPAHPVALALLRAAGRPVAAPSANRSTEVSPTTAAHVAKSLGDRVDVILDGGATTIGIESTVVLVVGERATVLRPGTITLAELEAALGEPVALHPAAAGVPADAAVAGALPERAAGGGPPEGQGSAGSSIDRHRNEAARTAAFLAPGMMERHYAPRAELRIVTGAQREAAVAESARLAAAGTRVGALLLAPWSAPLHEAVAMPADAAGYARDLYAALHAMDDAACEVAFVDAVPEGAEWAGVRDRLRRAATR